MVGNYTHQTFEPKYLTVYIMLKILNKGTLLLVPPNGKEHKMNINNVKQCTTLEVVGNTWN